MKVTTSTEWLFEFLCKINPETKSSFSSIKIPLTLIYRWSQPFIKYYSDSQTNNLKNVSKEQININDIYQEIKEQKQIVSSLFLRSLDIGKLNRYKKDKIEFEYFDNETIGTIQFISSKKLQFISQKIQISHQLEYYKSLNKFLVIKIVFFIVTDQNFLLDLIKVIWSKKATLINKATNKFELADSFIPFEHKLVTFDGSEKYSKIEVISKENNNEQAISIENIINAIILHIDSVSQNTIQIKRMILFFRLNNFKQLTLLFATGIQIHDNEFFNRLSVGLNPQELKLLKEEKERDLEKTSRKLQQKLQKEKERQKVNFIDKNISLFQQPQQNIFCTNCRRKGQLFEISFDSIINKKYQDKFKLPYYSELLFDQLKQWNQAIWDHVRELYTPTNQSQRTTSSVQENLVNNYQQLKEQQIKNEEVFEQESHLSKNITIQISNQVNGEQEIIDKHDNNQSKENDFISYNLSSINNNYQQVTQTTLKEILPNESKPKIPYLILKMWGEIPSHEYYQDLQENKYWRQLITYVCFECYIKIMNQPKFVQLDNCNRQIENQRLNYLKNQSHKITSNQSMKIKKDLEKFIQSNMQLEESRILKNHQQSQNLSFKELQQILSKQLEINKEQQLNLQKSNKLPYIQDYPKAFKKEVLEKIVLLPKIKTEHYNKINNNLNLSRVDKLVGLDKHVLLKKDLLYEKINNLGVKTDKNIFNFEKEKQNLPLILKLNSNDWFSKQKLISKQINFKNFNKRSVTTFKKDSEIRVSSFPNFKAHKNPISFNFLLDTINQMKIQLKDQKLNEIS